MPKPQLFHYAASAAALIAVGAAVASIARGAAWPSVLVALAIAAQIVVLVLVDRRVQIGMRRQSRDAQAVLRDIAALQSEVRGVRIAQQLHVQSTSAMRGEIAELTQRIAGTTEKTGGAEHLVISAERARDKPNQP